MPEVSTATTPPSPLRIAPPRARRLRFTTRRDSSPGLESSAGADRRCSPPAAAASSPPPPRRLTTASRCAGAATHDGRRYDAGGGAVRGLLRVKFLDGAAATDVDARALGGGGGLGLDGGGRRGDGLHEEVGEGLLLLLPLLGRRRWGGGEEVRWRWWRWRWRWRWWVVAAAARHLLLLLEPLRLLPRQPLGLLLGTPSCSTRAASFSAASAGSASRLLSSAMSSLPSPRCARPTTVRVASSRDVTSLSRRSTNTAAPPPSALRRLRRELLGARRSSARASSSRVRRSIPRRPSPLRGRFDVARAEDAQLVGERARRCGRGEIERIVDGRLEHRGGRARPRSCRRRRPSAARRVAPTAVSTLTRIIARRRRT